MELKKALKARSGCLKRGFPLPLESSGKLETEGVPMVSIDTSTEIDWTGCDLVERIPGKVSGRPIVRGTRIMPDPIVRAFDRGETMEEIREDWPSLSVDQIRGLVAFAHAHREQPKA
jgi:uncharacterized protein (DUF433 family)